MQKDIPKRIYIRFTLKENIDREHKEYLISLNELILMRVGHIASIYHPFNNRQKYLNKLYRDKFWEIMKR